MKLVRYNNELQPFGRLTAMRILLDKFSPPPDELCCVSNLRKEDNHMCFESTTRRDDVRDRVEEQNETNTPVATEPVVETVIENVPVAA